MNMHIIIDKLKHKVKHLEWRNEQEAKAIERHKDNKAEVKILKGRIKANERDIKHITAAIENLQKTVTSTSTIPSPPPPPPARKIKEGETPIPPKSK